MWTRFFYFSDCIIIKSTLNFKEQKNFERVPILLKLWKNCEQEIWIKHEKKIQNKFLPFLGILEFKLFTVFFPTDSWNFLIILVTFVICFPAYFLSNTSYVICLRSFLLSQMHFDFYIRVISFHSRPLFIQQFNEITS